MPTAAESITTAIADPASASSDGQSVSSRSASDLIALLDRAALLGTINKRRRGIRYSTLLNPGALDDRCASLRPSSESFGGG